MLNIQDYFEYILKKHRGTTVNPSIKIYINKIESRIPFTIKIEYYLELLTPETMKLLGSTKRRMTNNKNGEHAPCLEIIELIHCNVVNNSYQQNSRVLDTSVPHKSFGQLSNILPENFIVLETFDS